MEGKQCERGKAENPLAHIACMPSAVMDSKTQFLILKK